ncbi:MAG: hypothetical protein HYV97_04215 [Bdellovibrio sp.]|nr:hypothetical protein [Bdellovibrio sp.]
MFDALKNADKNIMILRFTLGTFLICLSSSSFCQLTDWWPFPTRTCEARTSSRIRPDISVQNLADHTNRCGGRFYEQFNHAPLKEQHSSNYQCPPDQGLHFLDPRFPATGVNVSFVPPFQGADARFAGNTQFIRDLVAAINRAGPSVQVNITIQQDQLEVARRELGDQILNNPKVRLIPMNASVSMWQQDTYEMAYQNGHRGVIDLRVDATRGDDLPKAMVDACQGNSLNLIPPPPTMAKVFAPNPGCEILAMRLVGSAETAQRQSYADSIKNKYGNEFGTYAQKIAASGVRKIDLSQACPMEETIPSSDFGGNIEPYPGDWVLMGNNIDGMNDEKGIAPWMKEQNVDILKVEARFLKVGHVDEIYNVVHNNDAPPCNFAFMYNSPAKGLAKLQARKDAGHGSENFGDEQVEFPPRTVQDRLSDQRFQIYNKAINKIVERDKELILNKLKAKSGCANPKVVDLPSLYEPDSLFKATSVNLSSSVDSIANSLAGYPGESVLPNLVNSISVNGSVIAPDPHYTPFKDEAQAAFQAGNVTPAFVDDTVYHNGYGDIHCGTNIIRDCMWIPDSI